MSDRQAGLAEYGKQLRRKGTRKRKGTLPFKVIDDWSVWLAEGDETEKVQILRQHVEKGLPCGDANFVQRLGNLVGRQLEYRPQGRPRMVKREI